MKHVQVANSYITGVLSGTIPACKWARLACKRQRDDLKRWDGKPRAPYYFDLEAADLVCRFIGQLPHVKGEWARRGESIKLEPWQCFLLTTVFGWKRRKDNLRRFRTCYTEVPRKNAKSTVSAGVALYMLLMDGEIGAEVYSAATTRDQAKIVWNDAKAMVKREPTMGEYFGVEALAHSIYHLKSGSKFLALSAEGNTLDGLNVHCAIIDELHAHRTRDVYDVLETATGSRSQPLVWNITTAGHDRSGICYEVRTYLTKLLDGVAKDESFFGSIWSIDDGDNWMDAAVWAKANPNYGVSIYPDDFVRLARKAQEMPSATNNFLTKRLNVWVNTHTAWLDMAAWERCGDDGLVIEDFAGQPCWVGLDLASKVDIAAMTFLFRREIEGKMHFYVFGRYYLPEQAVEDGRNSQYSGWARAGRLATTPGNVLDFEAIKTDLRDASSRFQIAEVLYDPWQATQLATELLAEGVPMIEMRATTQNFSEPMKEIEKTVLDGTLHHDACPVLAWMASNVVAHLDAKENIFPRKERPENKIDGIVSLIMAMARGMVGAEAQESVYEHRGVLAF